MSGRGDQHNRRLSQDELASKERFGIALRRTAFHASQSSQSKKRFSVEPLLGALGSKMSHEQVSLPLHDISRYRHVEIGLTKISVPFRNLVFENVVVPERIPGQTAHKPMVLMCVVPTMREDQIRFATAL